MSIGLYPLRISTEDGVLELVIHVQSAYQEKIPATNAIYAHAQDFSAGDELLLAILKAFIPQPLTKQQTKVFHVF
jgi:hypothetical protein